MGEVTEIGPELYRISVYGLTLIFNSITFLLMTMSHCFFTPATTRFFPKCVMGWPRSSIRPAYVGSDLAILSRMNAAH